MEINVLHHAYLLEGGKSEGQVFLDNLFEKMDFVKDQNPDYYLFSNESFSIDDARLLNIQVQNKAFNNKKVFVVAASRFSLDSQNALLKTFEEPTFNTHFFILLPFRDLLIPTLLSRLEVIRLEPSLDTKDYSKGFLSMTVGERMDFIKKFIEKDKNTSLPKNSLPLFLDSLLISLKERGDSREIISKVFKMRVFADDPAVMPRLILEHLAVVL